LLYAGGTTLSVQAHPEFTIGFALACCEMVGSKGDAPDSVVTPAQASLAEPLESARLGGAITRFLTRSAQTRRCPPAGVPEGPDTKLAKQPHAK
jgi:hypothetical protein